jgi:hypothetical protein
MMWPLAARKVPGLTSLVVAGLLALPAVPASAQSEAADPASVAPPATVTATTVTLSGYTEAYWQWNANRPSNGITNLRGFDNRHNSLTLSNAVLDAQWDAPQAFGRVALQVGSTPATYYAAEPVVSGGSGANASNQGLWQWLQQAYVGGRVGPNNRLTLSAGLFLSPIGPESMAVKDNWTWSRANAFFGLPFYHTGARASWALSDKAAVAAAVYNGWNSVVDNNRDKSVSLQWTWTTANLVGSVLYFGGVERSVGAAEGRPWRHLLDSHWTWHLTDRFSMLAHINGGVERGDLGTSKWFSAVLNGRFQAKRWLYLVARGEAFWEKVPRNAKGTAGAIFWPTPWLGSATVTADLRPHDQLSLRLELRHDLADGKAWYGGQVAKDAGGQCTANRDAQSTFTVGATSWF